MTEDIERYFSRHAASFDRLYRLPRGERFINHLLRRAVYLRYALTFEHAGDVRGKRVLDVGCGSGVYSIEFARRGAREVVGVDVAAPMIQLAQGYARDAGVENVCRFVQSDVMMFSDLQPFDITLAIGVFDYIADAGGLLAHLRRATAGRVLASFPRPSPLRMPLRMLRYAMRGLRLYYYERRQLETILSEAGIERYRLVEVKPSGGGYFLVAMCDGR